MENVDVGMIRILIDGLFLLLASIFFKQFLGRLDSVEKALVNVSKDLAVLASNHTHHESRFNNLEKAEERMEKETKSVRERLHTFGNELHRLTIQTEICRDHKELT